MRTSRTQRTTADRGELRFWRASHDHFDAQDVFGNRWIILGDLEAVAATSDSREIVYSDYPNALERIANSFVKPTSGNLWVTAKPGFEFELPGTEVHDAGSHGSLHVLDSRAPLIAAGVPDDIEVAASMRIVDVAPLCARILGIDGFPDVGPDMGLPDVSKCRPSPSTAITNANAITS